MLDDFEDHSVESDAGSSVHTVAPTRLLICPCPDSGIIRSVHLPEEVGGELNVMDSGKQPDQRELEEKRLAS